MPYIMPPRFEQPRNHVPNKKRKPAFSVKDLAEHFKCSTSKVKMYIGDLVPVAIQGNSATARRFYDLDAVKKVWPK